MLAWMMMLGVAAADPSAGDKITDEVKSAVPSVNFNHRAAHDLFHQGQKNAAVGLGLWGGGLVVGTAGFASLAYGGLVFGAPEVYVNAGAVAFVVGVAGVAGGPILGGVGLSRSTTALESLGADVDPTLTRFFWGSYGAQFITAGTTAIAVPILLAAERRKLRKLYEPFE